MSKGFEAMADIPADASAETELWFRRQGSAVLGELGIGPGQCVLDFGCGSGGYVLPLARAVAPGGRVVAMDRDPKLLEQLRERLKSAGAATEVQTVLSGPVAAPLAGIGTDSLDAVLLFDVLQHVEDWQALFAEIARVLKDRGRVCVYPAAVPHPGSVAPDRVRDSMIPHGFTPLATRRVRLLHAHSLVDDDVHVFERTQP